MIELGGYHIIGEIAVGSLFTTVKATRDSDGRQVCIKYAHAEFSSLHVTALLRHEFELTTALDLPGVAGALGLERFRGGVALVQEYVGDQSLKQVIAKQAMEPLAFCRFAIQLARILGDLHAHQVVHRDVKPSNVLVAPDGVTVKLGDFGIATRLRLEQMNEQAGPEALEGTLAYISPEQTGRTNRGVDYRSDLYSLGVSFYEMLTGTLPFSSESALELIHSHVAQVPEAPSERRPGVPKMLSEITRKLMAKTAEDRYQSAFGLIADLERCAASLSKAGSIPDFALGARDVPQRFTVPQVLYGRASRALEIHAAFDRTAAESGGAVGGAEVVLIAGAAGMGKSTLAGEVKSSVARRRGRYVSGKFQELRRDTPYSGIIEALRQIARELLCESGAALAATRSRILAALGPSARVLVEVVPEVGLIVGEQPAVPLLGALESEARFFLVMRGFVHAIASVEHPLVIVLDDLQWADEASLRLLRMLVAHPETKHLLLIGAWRPTSPGDAALRELQAGLVDDEVPVTDIEVTPLDEIDVAQLIGDVFFVRGAEASALAALVTSRTKGNPFFVLQFLRTLVDRGIVSFDPAAGRWQWELERISAQSITDNVVELLSDQIRTLGGAAQQALMLAAAIGSSFDLRTLATVAHEAPSAVAGALEEALARELITPVGGAYKYLDLVEDGGGAVVYRFVHDRVQQAAYELLPVAERAAIHRRVGLAVLEGAQAGGGDLEDRLFEVVNHLNLATSAMSDPAERKRLAELDLRAATKAKRSAAWATSLRLLSSGIELQAAGAWQSDYALVYALHVESVECAYLATQFVEMERLAAVVLKHRRTVLEEVPVHETLMRCASHRGEHARALQTGLAVLRSLGISLPSNPKTPHVMANVVATKLRLGRRKPEDLSSLPEMSDPTALAATQLLVQCSSSAYFVAPTLFPIIILRLVQLTVRKGATGLSAFGYVGYGLLLAVHLGNVEEGYRYGLLALRTLDRFGAEALRAKVLFLFNLFIRHWKEPVSACADGLLDGARRGQETGDIEYFAYASSAHCAASIFARDDLSALLPLVQQTLEALESYKQKNLHFFGYMKRTIELLTAQTALAPGHDAAEDAFIAAYAEIKDGNGVASCEVMRAMRSFLARDYAGCLESAAAVDQRIDQVAGQIYVPPYKFYQALSLLALSGTRSAGDEKAAMKQVAALCKQMNAWAGHGAQNYAHRAALLDAERARVEKRRLAALDGYDQAIALAKKNGYVQDEGIANELAARFHLAEGRASTASSYLAEARHAFVRWGGLAVARRLEEEFPQLAASSARRRGRLSEDTATSATENLGGALDFESVLKTGRAISGEIVLGSLLRSLMAIVIENAGAQRGLLILKRGDELFIEAEGSVEVGSIVVEQSVPLGASEASERLSQAIVNFVVRTGETVLLADAPAEGQFVDDPYIRRVKPRSVLCSPLLKQGTLTGVLYLENHLARGAFTPSRLEVLRLLSVQAAISIENAGLYASLENYNRTLEQKVEERTELLVRANTDLGRTLDQLRETQVQLVAQEKLASLGALTAGIAHEIKNPLNFVKNFSQMSIQLTRELGESLDRQAPRLDGEELADIKDTLGFLSQNAGKIEEHSRRANEIVDGMLLHSRAGGGDFEPADINAVLADSVRFAAQLFAGKDATLEAAIETEFHGALGLVDLVPGDMGRVFLNLVNNALYAMAEKKKSAPAYRPQLKVSTSDEGERVEIRIADNGVGIAEDIVDKIYNPFFTTKPAGEGTGLGLSISHDIVQRHHGVLKMRSVPGESTEFIISLPRWSKGEQIEERSVDSE